MTGEGKNIASRLWELPVDDLVDIHSQLLAAIYAKDGEECFDAERRATIQRRIAEIDAGEVEPLDAFGELARM